MYTNNKKYTLLLILFTQIISQNTEYLLVITINIKMRISSERREEL